MPRRQMYRMERYDAYLGIHLTQEMRAELELEARRAVVRPSEFIRLLLIEGLKSWRSKHRLPEEEST